MRTVVRWPVMSTGDPIVERLPLVVFAHGFRVSVDTYRDLLDAVAASGMVVAAAELPGESSALEGTPNESDLSNEPCDLEAVAASLTGAPPPALAGHLADAPVVFMGHSDGATAAAAAGFEVHSCRGPRAVAVVALSSNDIAITVPTPQPALLAITGTIDEVNPAPNTERLWSHVAGSAWLLTVDGGTHLGLFTSDAIRPEIEAVIVTFVRTHTVDATNGALPPIANGRLHLSIR